MVTGGMSDSPAGYTFDATYAASIELLRSDPERYFRENPTPVFGYPEPEPRRHWWRPRRGSR